MTLEETTIEINRHKQEIKTLWRSIDELKEKNEALSDLATSVKLLANNMENMAKEQTKISERLETLEKEPIEERKNNKRAIINCIISGVGGAIISAILAFIINGGV